MVRGLVEKQQIARPRQNFCEQDATSLSAGEYTDFFLGFVASEHHEPRELFDLSEVQCGIGGGDFLLDCLILFQPLNIGLPEVANGYLFGVNDLSVLGGQIPCKKPEQSGFAVTVFTDD